MKATKILPRSIPVKRGDFSEMPDRLSVIIPALNEERYIRRCLESVFRQNRAILHEVIVADFNSTDRTREICREFNVRIETGGTPAVARNFGASVATGNILLFLDADSVLPEGFLDKAIESFHQLNPAIISFFMAPVPWTFISGLVLKFYNYYSYLASLLRLPVFATCACCMMTTTANHKAVNGFDPEMAVLEEYDYVRRLKKLGKFRVISLMFYVSMRRYNRGCALKKAAIMFFYYFEWLLKGKVTKDKFGYWT